MTQIVKADGTKERFRPEKLRGSLKRAGASQKEAAYIIEQIRNEIEDGMTTKAIYRRAFQLLHKQEVPVAAKYSLRRALFNLGPTGFPFEDFVARIFELKGYDTQTRLVIQGKCAEHEVDVAAYTPEHSMLIEAKFHARQGIKSDLQVALYSQARFLDLIDKKSCKGDICGINELVIITNTKFTKAAEDYSKCSGIKLISWNYPKKGNFQDLIADLQVYPVTVLASLSQREKNALIKMGCILCGDILKKPNALKKAGLRARKIDTVLAEARQLCGTA